jgi:hypothetical protein
MVIIPPFSLKSQETTDAINAHPVNINFQYAGNVGLASIGIGTALYHQKIYLGLVYGYLPESVNDVEAHTIAIKANYRFLSRNISKKVSTSGYVGTNINFGITRNTYLKYPDYFPEDYYNTNAIHIAPYVGRKIDFTLNRSFIDKMGIYCELGTVDKYIADAFMSRQISFIEIFNLCFGISITLTP